MGVIEYRRESALQLKAWTTVIIEMQYSCTVYLKVMDEGGLLWCTVSTTRASTRDTTTAKVYSRIPIRGFILSRTAMSTITVILASMAMATMICECVCVSGRVRVN